MAVPLVSSNVEETFVWFGTVLIVFMAGINSTVSAITVLLGFDFKQNFFSFSCPLYSAVFLCTALVSWCLIT